MSSENGLRPSTTTEHKVTQGYGLVIPDLKIGLVQALIRKSEAGNHSTRL